MPREPSEQGDDDAVRPTKRTRVLVACIRCKGRRQKCDNATPACSNCAKSKSTCTYPNYSPSYVHQLEERLSLLEGTYHRHQVSDSGSRGLRDTSFPPLASPASMPSQDSPVATSSSGRLASGIGLLSSCAAAEPHYFGFSSGLTLAHFVEAAITPSNGVSGISLPSLAERPFSKQIPTAQTPLAAIPSQSTGARFIEAYISAIHPLYPFMNLEHVWRIHRDTQTETTSSSLGLQTKADLVRLHLIYAIGSRCIQLLKPGKIQKHLPESHLMSAMRYIPEVLKYTSIHAVEITLLLALHSMRSPSGASVWHLCGFAIRLCLELGLHRAKPYQANQALLEQQRRMLFWSCYIFERKSALVLGRPFAISDKDIEVQMPESSDQDTVSLALHRHYIALYQIHSKIRSTLHRIKHGASDEKVGDKVEACLLRLEKWKETVNEDIASRAAGYTSTVQSATLLAHSDSSDSENDIAIPSDRSPNLDKVELLLEYFKARRSLLQPLLTESGSQYSPKLSDYASCADASGQICQLYRQLHRLSALPFTLRDLHAVVIAGFTSIFCIAARPTLYNTRRASEIGACSTVLYVIAEQWRSARRYRDAFEAVAEKLVGLVSATQLDQSSNLMDQIGTDLSDLARDQQAAGSSAWYSYSSAQHEQISTASSNLLPREGHSDDLRNRLHDNDHGEVDGLFGSLIDDTFATFDMVYGAEDLRELLANEGLDWFSNIG